MSQSNKIKIQGIKINNDRNKILKIKRNKKNSKENRLIPLLFQNRFIIGYLKIIAQLIIVIDLQLINVKSQLICWRSLF